MSGRPARFVGNDVVDRASPLLAARAAEGDGPRRDWLERHLTQSELASPASLDRFWEIFAAKEAASKALAQAGVPVSPGAFRDFDVDLACRRVTHLPTELRADIALLETTADSIHAVVLYPASTGDERLAACIDTLPAGAEASDAARDVLVRLLEQESGRGTGRFAVGSKGGQPRILDGGQWRDWSVSLSHAGRFVAACALLP